MPRYISDFIETGYQQALFLSLIFIMIYVLTLIRLKTLNSRIDQPMPFTHKFYIFQNLIISSMITNVFVIAVAGILWANSKLVKLQFLMLLAVFVNTGITVILFAVCRNFFVEKYPSALVRQTFTQNEFNRFQKQMIAKFTD